MTHVKKVEEKLDHQEAATGGKDQRQEKQPPDTNLGRSVIHRSPGKIGKSSGKSGDDPINKSSQSGESEEAVESLREEELSGPPEDNMESASYSDTDEDEDEGLGDGNLGRSVRGSVEG